MEHDEDDYSAGEGDDYDRENAPYHAPEREYEQAPTGKNKSTSYPVVHR